MFIAVAFLLPAFGVSDNEAAQRLQEARLRLFELIDERLLAG